LLLRGRARRGVVAARGRNVDIHRLGEKKKDRGRKELRKPKKEFKCRRERKGGGVITGQAACMKRKPHMEGKSKGEKKGNLEAGGDT